MIIAPTKDKWMQMDNMIPSKIVKDRIQPSGALSVEVEKNMR
jgi:hypothetical protein